MDTSDWVWIAVAVIAAVVVIAVIAMLAKRKKAERDRAQAHELREHAAEKVTEVQRHDAIAKETEAKAAQARAEAERKEAEAHRLEAEAMDKQRVASGHREEHQEHLRKADELDPDVKHPAPTTGEPDGRRSSGDYSAATADDTVDRERTHRAGEHVESTGSDPVEPTTEEYSTSNDQGGSHRA